MSYPTYPDYTNVPYQPYEGSGYVTQPNINYVYGVPFEPMPCSCGRTSRHLWLTHWFRLFFMQERW